MCRQSFNSTGGLTTHHKNIQHTCSNFLFNKSKRKMRRSILNSYWLKDTNRGEIRRRQFVMKNKEDPYNYKKHQKAAQIFAFFHCSIIVIAVIVIACVQNAGNHTGPDAYNTTASNTTVSNRAVSNTTAN